MALVNLSRKVYALRTRAFKANCKPTTLMVDAHTFDGLMTFPEYEPYPRPSFMGLAIEGHAEKLSSRYSSFEEIPLNEPIKRKTLLCVRAVCEDTGRIVYFDDPLTDSVFLPRADRDELDTLNAKLEMMRIALADAIRRPMGVVPDSAVDLVTAEDLTEAEERREKLARAALPLQGGAT